ncbi:DMT family transporter [Veronia pacifica]|uniref:DMT family transporter n=1 Tax=Veronia pacifica TaxID=1080227 RepID=UPI001FE0877E|nr:DMT family transporter [Veronia pacifica]
MSRVHIKKTSMALLALIFFAANSVLCRMALDSDMIDPATFTSVRLISGAIMLSVLLLFFSDPVSLNDSPEETKKQTFSFFQAPVEYWLAAAMLFLYASAFSFAYMYLDTAIGALVLFAFVQLTMLTYAHWQEGGASGIESIGILVSVCGLGYLVSPGFHSPDLWGITLMAVSGIAWGLYSILGKRMSVSMLLSSKVNFTLSLVFIGPLFLLNMPAMKMSVEGLTLAALSGAFASALGYVAWYWVVKQFTSIQSGVMQMSVPVIAGLFAILFMGEQLNLRLLIAGTVILFGIAITFLGKSQSVAAE